MTSADEVKSDACVFLLYQAIDEVPEETAKASSPALSLTQGFDLLFVPPCVGHVVTEGRVGIVGLAFFDQTSSHKSGNGQPQAKPVSLLLLDFLKTLPLKGLC